MKQKTTLPYLLLLVLLVAIAITAYSILQHTKVSADESDTNQIKDDSKDLVTDTKYKDIQTNEYHTTYPKQAFDKEGFLYAQTLEGKGDITVKNIHQLQQGHLIITESCCQYGDASTKVQSIIIFYCDALGTVSKVLPISTRLPMSYLASKITADSFAILAKTSEQSYLIKVNIDLTDYSLELMPLADDGELFLFGNEIMILLEGNQTTLHYNHGVAFLPAGNVKAVYGFADHIKIFLNTASGYSVISCNEKMQTTQRINISGGSISAIAPLSENGVQKYLVVEKGIETEVYKYDSSFRKDNADKLSLGNSDNVKIYPSATGFMLIFTGKQGGVYMLSNKLEVTVSNAELFSSATNVYDSVRYSGGYYFLIESISGLSLVDLRSDTTTVSKQLGENSGEAFLRLNANGTLSIFYNAKKADNNFIQILGTAII